jgi:hypothetical protein
MQQILTMNNSNKQIIDKIISLIERDDSVDAPQDAIKWSKNIFRSRVAEPRKSIVEKIMAVLQVDLAPNKTVFGERSASASKARQMLFQAGDNSIDLRIVENEKSFAVRGQIFGEGFREAIVRLGDLETKTTDASEFSFPEISAGTYSLTLRAGEKEITIEDLEIK